MLSRGQQRRGLEREDGVVPIQSSYKSLVNVGTTGTLGEAVTSPQHKGRHLHTRT